MDTVRISSRDGSFTLSLSGGGYSVGRHKHNLTTFFLPSIYFIYEIVRTSEVLGKGIASNPYAPAQGVDLTLALISVE